MTSLLDKLIEILPETVGYFNETGAELTTHKLDSILTETEDIEFKYNKIVGKFTYESLLNTSSSLNYDLFHKYERLEKEKEFNGNFIEFYSRHFSQNEDIIYELSPISDVFIAHILNNMLDSSNEKYLENLHAILFINFFDNENFATLEERIIKIFRRMFVTLKIKTRKEREYVYFKNLKNSYLFDFMCKYRVPITIQSMEHSDLFREDKNKISIANYYKNYTVEPKSFYEPNLIIHYKRAMTTDDVSIKFLSFYHIIEYYFDTLYNKNIIENVKKWLIDPNLSFEDDKTLLSFVDKVRKLKGKSTEDGQGNESDAFKLVLDKYVDLDKLIQKLRGISKEQMNNIYNVDIEENNVFDFYKNNTVFFLDGNLKINFNDSNSAKRNIQNRIYKIRNSIVHNKDSHRLKTYNPYDDERELRKEIPLIESIATEIIINSSDIIKN